MSIVEMNKLNVVLNKPIYVGFCILDNSKIFIYEFHYDYIKNKFGNNAKLLYTDTDSLIYHFKTEDIYKNIKEDIHRVHTSDYKLDNKFNIELKNKKCPELIKDEYHGKIMFEFVGLQLKMYSYTVDSEIEDEEHDYDEAGYYVRGRFRKRCVSFAGFIGEQFNLMHNNARPHAAVIVRNFLQAVGIEAVEWSSRSPDLNPIKHLWDIPGRQIRRRRRQVLTLQDLRAALQEDWENLPQEAIQNLIQEDMVTCPYNNLHRLVWHRMVKHIFKCHREEDAKRKRESENKQNVEDQTESWDNGNYLNKNKQNAEDQEESWDNENYLTENKQNAEDQQASWTNENYLTENKQNVNDQDESWDNDDYLIENKQNSENEEECWDNESYLMY
ncbi:hypothetical protein TcasGA2_TC004212 [Tribolium castaneum]|uniref:CHHC U11-48K-type domain-containing protein n=1 Tax=Tribolium castaneum TaxID=7070 RepID=D7ELL7_TRICA|nr:hypothetical protein TcasGA2_TC004212 [Tribolium castaneum]